MNHHGSPRLWELTHLPDCQNRAVKQSWQFPGEMIVWLIFTLESCFIEAKFNPECENIIEYSVRGAAAGAQCPTCDEHHESKQVTLTAIKSIQSKNSQVCCSIVGPDNSAERPAG